MKKHFFTLATLTVLFLQTTAFSQFWVYQTSNTTQELNDVFMFDAQSGWVCGDARKGKTKHYNVLGNEVASLVNNEINAGNHTVIFNVVDLSSGVYYYRVEVERKFVETKQMVLLK